MTVPRRAELLLAMGSVALVLLIVEIGLRLARADAPQAAGYAPVNTATNRRAQGPTNSGGYRDLERTLSKPDGVHRVLALGDSFTWGAAVEFDDAWPQRLERSLNREWGERFEVINLAMPGFRTIDEASQLQNHGFSYGPDAVIVAYVLNDADDETSAEARRAARWRAEQRAPAPPGWLDRSAVLSFVRRRLRATSENRERLDGYRSMYRDDSLGWLAAQEALRTIGRSCREHGVAWMVVIFPLFGNRLDEGYPFPDVHAKVGASAAVAGARVVDLLPVYRGRRPDLLVVDGTNDEHPNEIAHRLASRAILHALAGLLPRPAA